MSAFRNSEKARQAALKADRAMFTAGADRKGSVRTKHGERWYDHVLPKGHETDNLLQPYRADALSIYEALGIRWHQGTATTPSANMCSSQVCATNFLMPFTRDAELAAELFRGVIPGLEEVLSYETANDPLYVTFEWIGDKNYLGEKLGLGGIRSRGRHFTSADAALRYRGNGGTHTVLIEWKYTESYPANNLKTSKSGTDRSAIYRHVVTGTDSPIAQGHYDEMFHEPFYQLFRQQALAAAMERAYEGESDSVSVLHISPTANTALHSVTSKTLNAQGNDVFALWKGMIRCADRFRSLSTRDVFGALAENPPPKLRAWADYVKRRYASVFES